MRTQTSLCSLLLSLETPNAIGSVAQQSYNIQTTSKCSDQAARKLVAHTALLEISCHASNVRFVPSNVFNPSSRTFTNRSKVVLLLWILYVICVSCMSCCLLCSLQPCVYLLVKGKPLGSLVCDVFMQTKHLCELGVRLAP